ncbi:uncharacterized protein B0T15DRAFT_4546 [Chaetomium strumarium]|uniref:Uncharacterized protein n=1 Tax=Chaetomium strumarium TaxID=1170767 RepID=A0AAJ0H0C9_9PEZI|nr:hypothetical protein B0T15DRAFT_4546 [Chaetomium strumarium]
MITHMGMRQLSSYGLVLYFFRSQRPERHAIALLYALKPQTLDASQAPSTSTRPRGCYPRMLIGRRGLRSFALLNLAACCACLDRLPSHRTNPHRCFTTGVIHTPSPPLPWFRGMHFREPAQQSRFSPSTSNLISANITGAFSPLYHHGGYGHFNPRLCFFFLI